MQVNHTTLKIWILKNFWSYEVNGTTYIIRFTTNNKLLLSNLPVGEYIFRVEYRKGSRSAENEVIISIIEEENIPLVQIIGNTEYSSNEKIVLKSNVTSYYKIQKYNWTVYENGKYLDLNILTFSKNLVIDPNLLNPGKYLIELNVIDIYGNIGYANMEIKIRDNPIIHSFNVEPKIGYALQTNFKFTCLANGYPPFTYQIGYYTKNRKFVHLITKSIMEDFESKLPNMEGSLEVVCRAIDIYGSIAEISTFVEVNPVKPTFFHPIHPMLHCSLFLYILHHICEYYFHKLHD